MLENVDGMKHLKILLAIIAVALIVLLIILPILVIQTKVSVNHGQTFFHKLIIFANFLMLLLCRESIVLLYQAINVIITS